MTLAKHSTQLLMHCGKTEGIFASYSTPEVTANAIIHTRALNPSSAHHIETGCFNVVVGVIQVADALLVHYMLRLYVTRCN